MTDDTLVNGLKAIFGTSAQGSAPAASALIPYMDASGNPVGLSSMANLASVLGALTSKGNINGADVFSLSAGMYRCSSIQSLTNIPSSITNGWGTVTVLENEGAYTKVIYITDNSNNAIWMNQKWDTTWKGWQRIDNYGTSSLSELASALGGLSICKETPVTSVNMDSYYDQDKIGCYSWSGAEANERGFLYVLYHPSGRTTQILYNPMQANEKIRMHDNGSWGNWYLLSLPNYLRPYNDLAELKAALAAV